MGWLGMDDYYPEWLQAFNVYGGPGIQSIIADCFIVELISPLDMTGKARISIKFGYAAPGETIMIKSTDGVERNLDNVEITVYDMSFNDNDPCSLYN